MIGKEILNYKVVALLGEGGMGTVYLAEHKYISQQKVAIKVIHTNIVNDYTREKLKQEAEHLASLDHPNIVKFINYHIDEDGNIYLIMEYADGVSLEKFINEVNGLVVEDRVCGLFEPILDAFGYAHKKGILHRDIKPSNIIITTEGIPKILDFGIAKIIGDESDEKIIAGTPSYMSPEQVRGEKLDARSDIYSLGVLLHQMMTGNAPYDTTTLSDHEINEKVVNEKLAPIRSFYKYVSDKTQKVVDKATAKEADRRYQNCGEFKKELHNAIYPPKIPRWMLAAGCTLLLLLAGGGWWYWDYNRTKVEYYKDYTEQWGVPVGIGRLSESEFKHRNASYRIEKSQGKVRRLTHVNSRGKTIEDLESEHADRPTDALYYYTPEGKIARVKVMNHGGKVLYNKVYNDNLKTAVFQFDDEHGTEKTLGASTVGYTHSLNASFNDQRGKISRYHLTYDNNGYVTKVEYAGLFNSRVHDADGIYGRSYTRDEKGRVTEESYLNLDGSPRSTKWGLGIKTFAYDGDDNWTVSKYYTVDREPALDAADGTAVYEMVYDKYGNITTKYYRNHDGELMTPRMWGVSGEKITYNNNGDAIKVEYIGEDGNPAYNEGNGATIISGYDENGFLKSQYALDIDGNRTVGKYNYCESRHVNNDKGDYTYVQYFDEKGEPTLYNNSYNATRYTYDSIGNLTSIFSYDIDCKLVNSSEMDDVAGCRLEYDNLGNLQKVINFNADSVVAPNVNNVSVILRDFDVRGNLVRERFYEDELCTKPQITDDGTAGTAMEYDDNGNLIKITNLGVDGKTVFDNNHVAVYSYTNDDNGYRISVRYYDADGKPTYCTDKYAGINWKRDNRGNIIEETDVDSEGKPARNYFIMRYKYDNNDNPVEEAAFSSDNQPAMGGLSYHRYVKRYDSRNQETEVRYFDTDGKLTGLRGTDVAITRYKYNNKGQLVETSFFGIDEKPALNEEHCAIQRNEYDAMGRISRQLYFGIDGKPTDPKVMVPEAITAYDKHGNLSMAASGDGKGNYIFNSQIGASIMRMVYDKKDNLVEVRYYDTADKPIVSTIKGYYKAIYKRDNRGNIIEDAYFDTADKPVISKEDGYHKHIAQYDGLNRKTTESYYGAKGQLMSINGVSRFDYRYSDNSATASHVSAYASNGSLIATLRWTGSEWVMDSAGASSHSPHPASQGQDWQSTIRELQAEIPWNLGADWDYMTVTSARITGSNSCEIVFTARESQYQMSAEQKQSYQSLIDSFCNALRAEYPRNVKINVKLLDDRGRTIINKNF